MQYQITSDNIELSPSMEALTKEKFEFIYSALNLEFYEVHAILLENKRLKTLLLNNSMLFVTTF